MAETELYMQCEEEEFVDWSEEGKQQLLAQNGHEDVSPEPVAFAAQSPVSENIKPTDLTVTAAPVVSKQLMSSVLQPAQFAAGGTPGQPVYITSQMSPVAPQNITTPLGFVLPRATGQSLAFLTPAQTGQISTTQLASPSGTPQPAPSEKYTTVQIPVNLTICGPAGVQNITALASVHVTSPPSSAAPTVASYAVNSEVRPSGVIRAPLAGLTPSVPAEKATLTAPVAGPTLTAPGPAFISSAAVASHTIAATAATHTVPSVASTCVIPTATSTLSNPRTANTQDASRKQRVLTPKPKKRRASRTVTQEEQELPVITRVFQGASRPPQTCSVCAVPYKIVPSLRGYLCLCNQTLVNGVQALSVKLRKKRLRRVSHRSPTSPSASGKHPSTSPPSSPHPPSSETLKHITTSEIPEGAPSPDTGDCDQHSKLIILVEDFFYGKDPGQPVLIENNQVPIMMKCVLCDKKLKNNIKLMNHMKHHMEIERQNSDKDCHTECLHCYRNFSSPFTLQCHVETVHSQVECTALCKICELSFENEPVFLNHMKQMHKPGEMPYICQVCKFRSSFYSDVVIHFRELHKDTNFLQCSYCLKVFKSSNSYQLHYSKHQRKTIQHCDKCRLHFLYTKEKSDHKALYHRTHLKPVQLMGLKPGTRVTIRAYSTNKGDDDSSLKAHNSSPPLKVPPSSSASASVAVPPAKRKPVESMLELMTKFQSQCKSVKKQFCMECNYEIPDFSVHFPTFVCCSLCHYCTCCSRAYANHMISNHIPRKTQNKYLNLYKPCPKLGQLSCSFCSYTTKVGDSMAKHLADNPDHCSSHCKFSGGFSRGYKRFVFIPTDLIRQHHRPASRTLLPFRVVQVGQRSLSDPSKPGTPNQCINLPVSTAHMPSIPIQEQPVDQSTVPDENCGTRPKDSSGPSSGAQSQQEHAVGGSLTLTQLKMLLYALCFGVPQAANHFDTQPEEVQSLLLKRRNQLGPPHSREGLIPRASDRLAEWVLCQREQQLPVNEGKLFSKASEIMNKVGGPGISYEWAVDFLLRYNLDVHALSVYSRLLPPKSQEHVHSFTRIITKQVSSQGFAQSSIGAMDEFSIFIDMEQLDPASADSSSMMSAFQLVGETDLLMDMVFTGLADGTMLPTMVFLKGAPLTSNVPALPGSIILEAKPEGFSDEERLQLWFKRVWRQHVDPGSGGKGLLVMDSYRGHMSDDFLAMLNSASTLPGIVPRSCSCCLQPLEAGVWPVLREFLQARWSQHVMEAPQDLIGAQPANLALLLASWLTEMLDVLAAKPQLLQRSFDQVLSCSADMAPEEVSKLARSLSEALAVRAVKENEAEEDVWCAEKSNTLDITLPSPLPSPPSNFQALKNIFEKDSDLESFIGFEDSEMTDC
ncbi:hypothetical protein AMEX_G5384 [Astyanax mexicanus]|uniref:Pogo transposable element with ZNF domain n=1 Tax=Astyanax mexicanus TaxID=7994 RepID=A0A8B9KFX6_ASTMX|nr:hypothetical protein AMEX_G5384 [Astyanax mexicanus]